MEPAREDIMKIKRFILGLLEANGYIIYQQEASACYIIDPGAKADVFLEAMTKLGLTCKGILLTHHHSDHVGGVEKIRKTLDCPVYIHREDLDMYKKPATSIENQDTFDLDGETIVVIHTPGHTRGSVCYYSDKSKLAFTGDTVFNVDLGRTDLIDGDETQMEDSIKNVIDRWPNEITIYPGHGDSCNMKKVRSINREYMEIIK
jgi:glyoxylase-like metal-dependent hydrolase (beta-lactamase superfamily II)